MIANILKWEGAIEINGSKYDSINEVPQDMTLTDNMCISLIPKENIRASQDTQASSGVFRITVRKYMTKQSTPAFDFMKKWNNDIPMPLMTMVGTIEKETSGMYKMNLHADTNFRTVDRCMNCGKVITSTVSKFFGMGPECGRHNYVNPFNSDEELQKAIKDYKENILSKITWNGWVIKSAITEMEEL